MLHGSSLNKLVAYTSAHVEISSADRKYERTTSLMILWLNINQQQKL